MRDASTVAATVARLDKYGPLPVHLRASARRLMSYKVYLPGSLSAVEWSQAVWRLEGDTVLVEHCEQERLHRLLVELLPKNGVIVDAGCGNGRVPIYFQRLGYRMLGVEISREACVIGKTFAPHVPFVQADVRFTPLRSHSVDAVVSLGVVEHNEAGPLAALHEAHRILKPGGLLILTVPFNNLFRRLLVNRAHDWVTRRRRRAGAELRFAEYRFSIGEARRFLEQTGFAVVSVHPEDALPPRAVGLWVDYNNLQAQGMAQTAEDLFVLPGLKGKIAVRLLAWFPWLVCAEVAFVAQAR